MPKSRTQGNPSNAKSLQPGSQPSRGPAIPTKWWEMMGNDGENEISVPQLSSQPAASPDPKEHRKWQETAKNVRETKTSGHSRPVAAPSLPNPQMVGNGRK